MILNERPDALNAVRALQTENNDLRAVLAVLVKRSGGTLTIHPWELANVNARDLL